MFEAYLKAAGETSVDKVGAHKKSNQINRNQSKKSQEIEINPRNQCWGAQEISADT